MAQFLYRIQPIRLAMLTLGPTESEAAALEAHFAYLKGPAADGMLLMAGRTLNEDETTFGIVVFEAESAARAAEIVENDPAVAQGVMGAELFPYRVSLWSAAGPAASAHGVASPP